MLRLLEAVLPFSAAWAMSGITKTQGFAVPLDVPLHGGVLPGCEPQPGTIDVHSTSRIPLRQDSKVMSYYALRS